MGDFNCIRKNEEREGGGEGGGVDITKLLNDIVSDLHLQDVVVWGGDCPLPSILIKEP